MNTIEKNKMHELYRSESDNYRYWSTEEIIQLRSLSQSHSAKEIALIMGRTLGSVKQALLSRGIKITKKPRLVFSAFDDSFIRNNVGKLTHREIGIRLNRSTLAISHRVIRLNLTYTYNGVFQYRYSPEDVELCRQLYDVGVSISDISEKMEIPKNTVSNYIHYRKRLNSLPKNVFRLDGN